MNHEEKVKSAERNPYLWIKQAVMFSMVGVMNTAIDFAVFFLLTQFVSMYYAFAQILSYGAGMLNSYLWNARVTFSISEKTKSRFYKFVILNLSVLLVTLFMMHSLLFLPLYINKLFSTLIGLGVNFILSKLWVFKA
ncbi:GtrA family protein [Sporolactobacillus sp. THM7-4]|nr:GtrA family protein [Sporolactobacillus sp. THM7-4]